MRRSRATCVLSPAVSALALTTLLLSGSAAHGERLLAIRGDAGLGSIGQTAHAAFQLGLDIREGALALGFAGRLRLALSDVEGQDGPIRGRDYDEPSDFVHILRYLDYQRRFGSLHVSMAAGELRGDTLGHGSLLRDYSNIADPDHLHAGLRLGLRHDRFDLDLLMDNLARPSVLGGRLALRPFDGFCGGGKSCVLSIGASGVLDLQAAAAAAATGRDGLPEVDEGSWTPLVERETLGLAAVDIELLFAGGGKTFKPYADLATSFRGVGLHVGASAGLPISGAWRLAAQLEYRLSSGGYAPDHIGTFYDLERYQASLANSGQQALSKNEALERGLYGGHGLLAQLGLEGGRALSLKVGYRYHPGPDGSQLWARVVTEPTSRLTVGVLGVFRALGQSSRGADGIATLAEARYRVTPYLYAVAQFARSWALADDTRRFAPLTRFNIGMGGTFSR